MYFSIECYRQMQIELTWNKEEKTLVGVKYKYIFKTAFEISTFIRRWRVKLKRRIGLELIRLSVSYCRFHSFTPCRDDARHADGLRKEGKGGRQREMIWEWETSTLSINVCAASALAPVERLPCSSVPCQWRRRRALFVRARRCRGTHSGRWSL